MRNGFFSLPTWGEKADQAGLPKCARCGLLRQCYSPQMGVGGSGRRKILVVGEAPGEQEDRQGKPFIGDAGQLLRRAFREAGADLNDCSITNSILCRPPENKIEDVHIDSCRPALLRTLDQLRPEVVLLLGASAAETLIGQEWTRNFGSISRWVGCRIPSQKYRAWLCPTYHPSYLMRMGEDPVLFRLFAEHLESALALEGEPLLDSSDWGSRIELVDDPEVARRRMRKLVDYDDWIVFDYETDRLKPDAPDARLLCVSFCYDDGNRCWATDLNDDLLPDLSAVLNSKRSRKAAANLKFEERWTRAKLGHGVRRWGWDTMLATHFLDNRPDICSVKFQAYVRFGVVGYDKYLEAEDHRAGNMDQRERLLYCGWDSLVEYKTMQCQWLEWEQLEEQTCR